MRVLETQRLLLKPVEESDLPHMLELQWDKEVVKYMKFSPLSMENQKTWIKSLGKNSLAFTINLKTNNTTELIGLVTLNNIDHVNQRASWGTKLKSDLQGKGIGVETALIIIHYAFHYLNMQKIYADIIEDNISSQKLTDRIGARKEGLLINHLYHNGEFKNLVLVGILKDEFYNKNRKELIRLGLIKQ